MPLVHHLTHLPVIVDPSHATGKRWLVTPLAISGVAVGADGIMVEVHPTPDDALSDAEQQLTLDQFRDMMAARHAGPRPRRVAAPPADRRRVRRERRRAVEALSAMTAPGSDVAVVRAARAPARRPAPARRQVDQPSRPAAGRAGDRGEPDRVGRRRRGRALHRRDRPGARGDRGADPRRRADRRLPGGLAGGGRAPRPGGDARLRQLRHEPAADQPACSRACPSRARWTATIHCVGVRWLVSSNRCVGWGRHSTPGRTTPSLP